MRLLPTIVMVFFSYLHFDINKYRTKKTGTVEITIESEFVVDRKKQRQKKRKYDNYKYKRRQFYKRRSYKFASAKPRDNRFSDQQKLRRMYRNG